MWDKLKNIGAGILLSLIIIVYILAIIAVVSIIIK